MKCPDCGSSISIWKIAEFFRLGSIFCPECGVSLKLDQNGRIYLWIPVAFSFLLSIYLVPLGYVKYSIVFLLIAGLFAGSLLARKYGKIYVVQRDDESKKNDADRETRL